MTFPPGQAVERDSRVRWKYSAGVAGSSTASQVQRLALECLCTGNKHARSEQTARSEQNANVAHAHYFFPILRVCVQFAIEVPKRSSLSTAFSDRSFQGTYNQVVPSTARALWHPHAGAPSNVSPQYIVDTHTHIKHTRAHTHTHTHAHTHTHTHTHNLAAPP